MSRKQYPAPRNQCVECEADAVDRRMVCDAHLALYDDAIMQKAIDRYRRKKA